VSIVGLINTAGASTSEVKLMMSCYWGEFSLNSRDQKDYTWPLSKRSKILYRIQHRRRSWNIRLTLSCWVILDQTAGRSPPKTSSPRCRSMLPLQRPPQEWTTVDILMPIRDYAARTHPDFPLIKVKFWEYFLCKGRLKPRSTYTIIVVEWKWQAWNVDSVGSPFQKASI